jgi:dCTP deaminase
MILLRETILREMKEGNIGITPFSESCLGRASVDLSLGNLVYRFKKEPSHISVTEDLEMESFAEPVQITKENPLVLKSGEMAIGITQEVIKLSADITAFLEGRSRFARAGLGVHVTSSFIRPGTESSQTLEIVNHSPIELVLRPGLRMCQIIFMRCES